jgi:hypothetical protein
MMQKKGSFLGFTGIEVFRFVGSALSFIVLIIIAFGILAIWGPKEKAEAASLSLMEDLRAKLSRLDDGDSVIVSGFLDKDVRLVSFNSDYFQKDIDNGILRPSKCGSRSNSCICLCKDDRCTNVLECKGFSRQQVETISSVSAAEHWMPVTTTVVSGGRYDGDTPVKENVDIINYLAANNPSPAALLSLYRQLLGMES